MVDFSAFTISISISIFIISSVEYVFPSAIFNWKEKRNLNKSVDRFYLHNYFSLVHVVCIGEWKMNF